LPEGAHGKEGVSGSSPEEGFEKFLRLAAIAAAEVDGGEVGLALVDRLDLDGYQYFRAPLSTRAYGRSRRVAPTASHAPAKVPG
jgi:hypothetical protein